MGTNPIWLSVDETTDACGRYIANVLIGSLKKDEPSKSHLICSKQLEKTNNATVTKLVLDSLRKFRIFATWNSDLVINLPFIWNLQKCCGLAANKIKLKRNFFCSLLTECNTC